MTALVQKGAWTILFVSGALIFADRAHMLIQHQQGLPDLSGGGVPFVRSPNDQVYNAADQAASSTPEELDFSGLVEVHSEGDEPGHLNIGNAKPLVEDKTQPIDTTGLRRLGPALGVAGVSNTDSRSAGVPISHGIVWVDPAQRFVAPFLIRTGEGSDYFAKLIDARTGVPVMTMFLNGGTPLEVEVPLGTFRLRYATGTRWQGEADLFGPETTTAEAEADFTFQQTPDGYSGYEVQLIQRKEGNLGTAYLPRAQF